MAVTVEDCMAASAEPMYSFMNCYRSTWHLHPLGLNESRSRLTKVLLGGIQPICIEQLHVVILLTHRNLKVPAWVNRLATYRL